MLELIEQLISKNKELIDKNEEIYELKKAVKHYISVVREINKGK